MIRRMTRWVMMLPSFILLALLLRWVVDEQRSRRRLTAPATVPWPPVADEAPAPAPVAEEADPGNAPPPAWVEPVEGTCPDGYPVKVKRSSGLYHLPGMVAYRRTRPDRCYTDPDAAESDGFIRARR